MILIRKALQTDCHHIVDIDIKCFEHAWSADYWRAISKEYQCDLAAFNKEPVGIVVYSREVDGNGLPGVWLRKLAVKKQYRRQGIGIKLFDTVVAYARAINAVDIRLVTPESSCYGPDSIAKFLAFVGMTCTEVMKDQFEFAGEVEDGFLFKKELRLI